ncbi:MAG TPA: c-type cytochrome [Gemmatimonadales bacterium]|nr:c-type cytochrome [Gemmatimonadales bacterium]
MSAQRGYSAALALLLCGAAGSVQAQANAALPEGVTPAMVSAGGSIFKGPGMCTVCHGIDGKGGVGPNLTDGTWIHSKGSYQEIVQQITTGVPTKQSKSGIPMPPKGGSGISEAQVKDVAAYVWTLSHPGAK